MRLAIALAFATFVAIAAAESPAPLSGVWEGTLVREGRSQPVAMVCRPRGAAAVSGMFYFDGQEFGPIEDSRVTRDSLKFHSGPFQFAASIRTGQMSVTAAVSHGTTFHFDLSRTTEDTLAIPSSVATAPSKASSATAIPSAPDAVYRAHATPAATTSSTDPCLARGTLLLVGGGAGQADLYARFLKLAGGPSALILDLPDAGMALKRTTIPPDGRALANLLGAQRVDVLHAASREQADSESFVAPLLRAGGVWIDGGDAEAIFSRYLGTLTERELVALLGRGGVIGGTSAGALIWGSHTMVFREGSADHPYSGMSADDLKPGDPHEPGFGLLRNVTIVPHFAEFKMEAATIRMVAAHPGLLAIGIDEATALEVHGDIGRVLGRGHVTVFDGRDHAGKPFVTLSENSRYDLRARRVL